MGPPCPGTRGPVAGTHQQLQHPERPEHVGHQAEEPGRSDGGEWSPGRTGWGWARGDGEKPRCSQVPQVEREEEGHGGASCLSAPPRRGVPRNSHAPPLGPAIRARCGGVCQERQRKGEDQGRVMAEESPRRGPWVVVHCPRVGQRGCQPVAGGPRPSAHAAAGGGRGRGEVVCTRPPNPSSTPRCSRRPGSWRSPGINTRGP